ncbi:MAG: hypothetical protein ACOVNL_13690 [Prochlorococcaceae cyanobacterium]
MAARPPRWIRLAALGRAAVLGATVLSALVLAAGLATPPVSITAARPRPWP